MDLDELNEISKSEGKYIKYTQLEEPIEITLEEIEKVEDPQFTLPGRNYKIRFHTDDGQMLDCTTNNLLHGINVALHEANGVSGVTIRIEKLKEKGKYKVDLVDTPYGKDEKVKTK